MNVQHNLKQMYTLTSFAHSHIKNNTTWTCLTNLRPTKPFFYCSQKCHMKGKSHGRLFLKNRGAIWPLLREWITRQVAIVFAQRCLRQDTAIQWFDIFNCDMLTTVSARSMWTRHQSILASIKLICKCFHASWPNFEILWPVITLLMAV